MTVQIITQSVYGTKLIDQDVPIEHCAFVCPSCGVIQSALDHMNAGKDKKAALLAAGVICMDPDCHGTDDKHTLEIRCAATRKLFRAFAPATPEQALLLLSTRDQKDIQPVPELTWAEGELE